MGGLPCGHLTWKEAVWVGIKVGISLAMCPAEHPDGHLPGKEPGLGGHPGGGASDWEGAKVGGHQSGHLIGKDWICIYLPGKESGWVSI